MTQQNRRLVDIFPLFSIKYTIKILRTNFVIYIYVYKKTLNVIGNKLTDPGEIN